MMLKNLFWNTQQRRLRTLWRLVAQSVLLMALSSCLSAAFLLPGMVLGTLEPQIQEATLRLANLVMFPATLLSVWLAGYFLDRRRFSDFGMRLNWDWALDLGAGLALGALLMAAIFLVERAAGWVTVTGTLRADTFGGNFPVALFFSLLLYLAVGIYEELLFRGYFLRNLAEGLHLPGLGSRGALLLSWGLTSAVFGLAHALNPNASLISTINIAFAGIFLGLGYVLSGNMALPIGLHITWNFFQGTVFGFPVSGGAAATSFFVIEQGGPTLWTGGAFGPEAGLLGILAMLAGLLLIVFWVRWRYKRVAFQETLAEYTPRVQQSPLVEEPLT
ncbi:MAG: CPBP family intramembrane metalloprotease [Anaerolineae bacterium]|nr:CPBP family intramembrane metalloprotease [Anaerolineae bacterium]